MNMLSKAQQKLIHELSVNKKIRRERGLFLIEGVKFIRDARRYLEFSFNDKEVSDFRSLISTDTPQSVAGVARIPSFNLADIAACKRVVILDNIQDPGNVGAIMRACLAFEAGLILVDSADPTNPKAVRASAAAILKTPWVEIGRLDAVQTILSLSRPICRLELREGAIPINDLKQSSLALIAGNEGRGISLDVPGATSVYVPQNAELESLNVAMAVSIALYEFSL